MASVGMERRGEKAIYNQNVPKQSTDSCRGLYGLSFTQEQSTSQARHQPASLVPRPKEEGFRPGNKAWHQHFGYRRGPS